MYHRYLKPIIKSESGYASFVIALVTIIVVSLIVVAFASDSRLEQKNSLANSEATQAYYAAESGINDAYAVVINDINNNVTPPSTTGCAQPNSVYVNNSSSNQINGTNVEYSCLIVNATPNSLKYNPVQPGIGETIPITTTSNMGYITVSWEESGPNTLVFGGCPSPATTGLSLLTNSAYTASNCSAGVLQVDLFSGQNLSSDITNNDLESAQATTVYLEPIYNLKGTAATDNIPTSVATQDEVFPAQCGTTLAAQGQYACTQSIEVTPDTTYYLHLQSFYSESDISITTQAPGTQPSGSNNLNISGAQVLIDSTGEADGQLKRIQETICVNKFCDNNVEAPSNAIQSTECIDKNFPVYPGASTDPTSSGSC